MWGRWKRSQQEESICQRTSKFFASNTRQLYRMIASLPNWSSNGTKDHSFYCWDDGCQPFSVVEDQGFVHLLNHLQPRYQLPSRKYFPSTMIPQLYDRCKNTVKKITEAQNYVALTSDIWSSSGHDSVISFIAHFITDKFIRGLC